MVRQLPLQAYAVSWQAMQDFTNQRSSATVDEIWLLQHWPVFTQGQAGKAEHLLHQGDIPLVQSDRGGQVTYHGPGQLIVYLMLDLKRLGIGVRVLVSRIEQALIDCLSEYGITANADPKAPGVYVSGSKIASLGLRVRKGCSFHGLALNVDMDLSPFERINPCGYPGLDMVQMSDFAPLVKLDQVAQALSKHLATQLHYQNINQRA
ncbi:MAG: lipoyl(octanoyl) transferase LipB [Gammaproteobacteria bacterium]|nr:lipoyl(octanoyl) transferase LipB [Gammaproteobacteria bacterium]